MCGRRGRGRNASWPMNWVSYHTLLKVILLMEGICCLWYRSLGASVGFTWQGFGTGAGLKGQLSVRRHQKLPPCQTEPVSAISKTDPLLAKVEPTSGVGHTSVVTYLRKGKNCCTAAVWEKSEKNVRETALRIPESMKKEGEGVLQAPEQRFPCSPWWRPWWGRLSPCSSQRSTVEQILTCSPWRTPCWSRRMCSGGSLSPWRACVGVGSYQELKPLERSPRRSRFSGRSCGVPRWSSPLLTDCTPCRGSMLKQFLKDCGPWEGPMLEQRKTVRKEEWQRWSVNGPTTAPIPCAPVLLGKAGRGRKWESHEWRWA